MTPGGLDLFLSTPNLVPGDLLSFKCPQLGPKLQLGGVCTCKLFRWNLDVLVCRGWGGVMGRTRGLADTSRASATGAQSAPPSAGHVAKLHAEWGRGVGPSAPSHWLSELPPRRHAEPPIRHLGLL